MLIASQRPATEGLWNCISIPKTHTTQLPTEQINLDNWGEYQKWVRVCEQCDQSYETLLFPTLSTIVPSQKTSAHRANTAPAEKVGYFFLSRAEEPVLLNVSNTEKPQPACWLLKTNPKKHVHVRGWANAQPSHSDKPPGKT